MKRILAILLALMMMSSLCACGGTNTNSDANSNATSGTNSDSAPDAGSDSEPAGLKIGVSLMELETFQTYVAQGIDNYCVDNPDVTYELLNAQSDITNQISQVENLIAQGCNAIIISPVDADATQAISDACDEAGIPLISVSTDINSERTCCVAADNTEAGTKQANLMLNLLGSTGNIAVLMGAAGNMNATGRTDAYHSVIDGVDGMEIIAEQTGNWLRADALSVVENWLQSGMEIDGILANNDEMAIGAALACQEVGLAIPIIGVGATEEGLNAVLNGTISGTVVWSGVQQGYTAMDCAVKAIKGETLDSLIYSELPLVTSDDAQYWLDELYG